MKKDIAGFPTVSIRDLGKKPGTILERVVKGERLIVCRHGLPIATIQPLTGYVLQPGVAAAHDVAGTPLADVKGELARLSDHIKQVLLSCRNDQIKLRSFALEWPSGTFEATLEEMRLRGLSVRTDRGMVLTGLGLFLRDELRMGGEATER